MDARKKQSRIAISPSMLADVESGLMVPQRTCRAFDSLDKVRRSFALPVTMGAPKEERESLDMAFDSAGGYSAIFESLQQHASEMGQYPVTSFIGYGALQQIAQNGMIRACVQTVADDITREWIEVQGGDDTDPETVRDIADTLDQKYHLKDLIHQAAATVGFMGGAFIFIDTGAEGEDLTLPLRVSSLSAEMSQGMDLKFTLVDPVNVTPGEYNATNPLKQDYMQPKWWWVLGQRVHASRLITVCDNQPPMLLRPSYNFLGIPQAQILWDYVLHWNECRINTAELLKKISLLVMQTDTQAIFSTPGGVQNFDVRMQALQRYRDNNSVFVCDKQDEAVSNVQTSTAGCTDIVRQSLEMIAAINRTPAVKLLGISPSGFNATGESDIKNYCDHVRTKQELYRSAITQCLHAIEIAENGKIDPSITFEFKPLNSDNDSAKAMNAQTRINTLGAALDRQIISPEEMRTAVKADPDMGLSFIEDDLPDQGDGQDFKTDDDDGGDMQDFMQQQAGKQAEAQQQAAAKAAPGHEDGMKQANAEAAENAEKDN